jgi:MFS superfamily sulfate permease-like transporter
VVAVGAIHAILFAVVLATLRFVRLTARPKTEILGRVEGLPGFHSIELHPTAATIPGLLLFRFNAPIVFFNASYFKRELLAAANAAGPGLKWFVVDMLPVTLVDATGLYTTLEVAAELDRRGTTLIAAGRQTEWHAWAKSRKLADGYRRTKMFPTLRAAVKAYRGREGAVADVVRDAGSD